MNYDGAHLFSFSLTVTIHVTDDGRDHKRDFTCPQDLLLEQMGYFKDLTSGQSLEDVDISVHCDILIFEWLMAWIKHSGGGQPAEDASEQVDEIHVLRRASKEIRISFCLCNLRHVWT